MAKLIKTITARVFLVQALNELQARGQVAEVQVQDQMALATVTTPDGTRYNVQCHRLPDPEFAKVDA